MDFNGNARSNQALKSKLAAYQFCVVGWCVWAARQKVWSGLYADRPFGKAKLMPVRLWSFYRDVEGFYGGSR